MTDRIIDHIDLQDRAPVAQAREGWALGWVDHEYVLSAQWASRQVKVVNLGASWRGTVRSVSGERVIATAPTLTECTAALKAAVREILLEALASLDAAP
jgi:hypothetical protein